MILNLSPTWKATYPTAHIGALAMSGVCNPRRHAELEQRKRALEADLRTRFAGHNKADLAALPVMQSYRAYYKRFRKTYHVLLQLRSVALENKSLPDVAALVEASFMAELNTGLLTAAHDLDRTHGPLTIDVARGDEQYVMLNGKKQTLKTDDMILRDAEGVICSVIYGLDRRTAIGPGTTQALFIVYAPEGIASDAVSAHLEEIQDLVQLIAPEATVETLRVYGSNT